jgi:hypothetical protein
MRVPVEQEKTMVSPASHCVRALDAEAAVGKASTSRNIKGMRIRTPWREDGLS